MIPITATEKNTDSTPGYPKCLSFDTEADFLEEVGWEPYTSEVDAIMSTDYRPVVLWYLFLKKEQLKKEKIDQADIRQILCTDPIYTRIGAMLDQDQNTRIKNRTEDSSCQVGWCPFFGGFQARISRLISKKNRWFVEMDWTRYDGTVPSTLLQRIRLIRFDALRRADRERYGALAKWYNKHLSNRYVVLPSGEITRQRRGNPSGQFSTSTDNSMVNYWLQAFEFHYLNPDVDHHALWEKYDTITYGDDRLSTTPIVSDNYEERVVQMYKDVFGMWVKPTNIKVQQTPVGLSFCGWTISHDLTPVAQRPEKFLASIITPCVSLPDLQSLHGKLLCMQILMANSDRQDIKDYIDECLERIGPLAGSSVTRFTTEDLAAFWREGPENGYG